MARFTFTTSKSKRNVGSRAAVHQAQRRLARACEQQHFNSTLNRFLTQCRRVRGSDACTTSDLTGLSDRELMDCSSLKDFGGPQRNAV